jgi:hypothetical protein
MGHWAIPSKNAHEHLQNEKRDQGKERNAYSDETNLLEIELTKFENHESERGQETTGKISHSFNCVGTFCGRALSHHMAFAGRLASVTGRRPGRVT